MRISGLIDDLRAFKLLHGDCEVQIARRIGVNGISFVDGNAQIEAELDEQEGLHIAPADDPREGIGYNGRDAEINQVMREESTKHGKKDHIS